MGGMRGAHETITVWHRAREGKLDVWSRTVIDNCAWEMDYIREIPGSMAAASKTAVIASGYIVLIPAPVPTEIAPGDIIAKGAHDTEITGQGEYTHTAVLTSLRPDAFTVKAVTKNDAPYKRGPHWECLGL